MFITRGGRGAGGQATFFVQLLGEQSMIDQTLYQIGQVKDWRGFALQVYMLKGPSPLLSDFAISSSHAISELRI